MAKDIEAITGNSLIGMRLKGRYRIVGEIGAGVGGKVCQAEDDATGHRIAVRLLPKALAGASNGTQTLQRMSRSVIAVSAAHSGLASVLAFGESEQGWPFAVMELVEGRRLSEVLAEGKQLDVAVAMRWALDLGGAIETLHNMGLVHGAVRPRNVAVLEDGRAKLLDVELSGLRDLPALSGASRSEAPAQYLAPELARGAPLTEKADIYAFAAILYEMLAGVSPFRAATRDGIRDLQASQPPAPIRTRRRSVPAPVDAVVAKALDGQPDNRPLMQDLLNRLWSEANGPTTPRRRRVAVVGAAVLAAAVVGLGAWGFVASRTWAPQAPEQATRPAAPEPAARPAPPVTAAPAPPPPPAPAPVALPPAPAPVPVAEPVLKAEPPRPAPFVAPPHVVTPAPAPAPKAEPQRPAPVAAPPQVVTPAPAPVPKAEPQRPAPVVAPPQVVMPTPAPAPKAEPQRPAPVVAPPRVATPAPAPAPKAEPQRPATVATPPVAAPVTPTPVPPPARTVPPAPRPAPASVGVERREPPRAESPTSPAAPPRAPAPPAAAASPARPAPPRPEGYDPNAVIDWLLNPSSTGRQ